MSLTMEAVLDRLQTIQGNPPAKQSPEDHLTIIECKHCGARYWHHLGDLATDGKIAGGPCCFGHEVLTVAKYPTEAAASAAWGKWHDAMALPIPETCDSGEMVAPI